MANVIAVSDFMICIVCSLIIGFVIAAMYMYKSTYSKSFIVTLAMLPAVVCVVIMMVNGNIGAGVAVAGAFSLVRFRSVPGTAKEIGVLFMAMGAGLIMGMGYIAYAFLFVIILGLVNMLCLILAQRSRRHYIRLCVSRFRRIWIIRMCSMTSLTDTQRKVSLST